MSVVGLVALGQEVVVVVLMLLAAVRGHAALDSGRALAWPLLVGFVVTVLGSAYLWLLHEIRPRTVRRV
jgi:hypothetical protein